MPDLDPTPLLDFTPVRFKRVRHDGWSADRQRRFIAALAETGSVSAAARRVGTSSSGTYDLYNHPDGASLRAAWDRALAHGVGRIHDVAMERAIDGTPVPVFYKGEQVGEYRRCSDRVLVTLLRHHAFRHHPSPVGHLSRASIERHAAENCPACRERREAEARAAADAPAHEADMAAMLDELLRRYELKVGSERHHRLNGQIVAADFLLRQLTWLEIALENAGLGQMVRMLWEGTLPAADPDPDPLPIAEELAALRERVWAAAGDPPRPPAPDPAALRIVFRGGPEYAARDRAQRAVERRMAEAQAEWEAAATEEGWARFLQQRDG